MVIVAWDVDDVLSELVREWIRFKQPAVKYEDIVCELPDLRWGYAGTQAEFLAELDDVKQNHHHEFRPCAAVLDWFRTTGHLAEHVAITSAPRFLMPVMSEWVFRMYGEWIYTVHCMPSKRPNVEDHPYFIGNSKGRFLRDHYFNQRPVLLIDDLSHNIQSAHDHGIPCVTFPQPWNGSKESVGAALERVTHWVTQNGDITLREAHV